MEALIWKKIDDKAAKNVKAALENAQMSKYKAALLAPNQFLKKKSQKIKMTEKLIINLETKLEPTSKVNSLSKD